MKLPDPIVRWWIGGRIYSFFYQERTDGMEDILKNKKGINIKEGIRGKDDRLSK